MGLSAFNAMRARLAKEKANENKESAMTVKEVEPVKAEKPRKKTDAEKLHKE